MKGRRKLTYSFTEILNRRQNLQVGLRVLISMWAAADSAQTLADAVYSIKHNLQVCQPNASPSYPCTMGTANTALRTSGSVNHGLLSCLH